MRSTTRNLVGVPLLLLALDLLAIGAAPFLFPPRSSDLLVVLGNTVLPGGAPSPRLQARLDIALQAWNRGLASRILVSGGIEPGTPPRDEARAMAAYLRSKGVPASAILLDPTGNNTALTAAHTVAVTPRPHRVLVVTQWFHVARTLLAVRQAGIPAVSAISPNFFEARDLYSLAREAVALPVYLVRGGLGLQ